jgi:hypothetical protein
VNKRGVVRRARIFYLRELTGKKARIKEEETNSSGYNRMILFLKGVKGVAY